MEARISAIDEREPAATRGIDPAAARALAPPRASCAGRAAAEQDHRDAEQPRQQAGHGVRVDVLVLERSIAASATSTAMPNTSRRCAAQVARREALRLLGRQVAPVERRELASTWRRSR